MSTRTSSTHPVAPVPRKTGGAWPHHLLGSCAYCGTSIDFAANKPGRASATKDHVIPRSHKAGGLWIPACAPCNTARAAKSLPEFFASEHFDRVRRKKQSANAWSLRNLWLVLAYAAVEQAYKSQEE